MKLSSKESYPSTRKFEEFLIKKELMALEYTDPDDLYWNLPLSPDEVHHLKFNSIQDAAQILHEMLGEYEHGTVDTNVVLKMCNEPIIAELSTLYYSTDRRFENEDEVEKMIKAAEARAMETLRGIYEDIIETMLAK